MSTLPHATAQVFTYLPTGLQMKCDSIKKKHDSLREEHGLNVLENRVLLKFCNQNSTIHRTVKPSFKVSSRNCGDEENLEWRKFNSSFTDLGSVKLDVKCEGKSLRSRNIKQEF
jgi:hypothetical protein